MILAIWLITLLGLVFWSLLAWGLHALLTLDPAWVQGLGGHIGQIPFGDWIERFIPGWQALLLALVNLAHAALGWIGGAALVLVWAVWAVGALLLALTAALLTLMVVLLRDKPAPAKPL